jgi:hypothetical protein
MKKKKRRIDTILLPGDNHVIPGLETKMILEMRRYAPYKNVNLIALIE